MDYKTILSLFVLTAAAVGVLSLGAAADHGSENTDFTVSPDDRNPGAESVQYRLEVTLEDGTSGIGDPNRAVFRVEDANLEPCAASGALDSSDFSLEVQKGDRTESYSTGDGNWDGDTVEISIDEDAPSYRLGDTLVLTLEGCVTNVDSEGWYQAAAVVEGTEIDGDDTVEVQAISHYFGICEGCESDSDARNELGPAPPNRTPEPTATPTDTPQPTATQTETPRPTATPTNTPQPTATQTETPRPTATPTNTPQPTATQTETSEPSADDSGRRPPGAAVFGVDPLAIVGGVAIISITLAALGARRL